MFMGQVAAAAELIPLEADSQGVLRVAGTHVTLDTVVEMYRAGSTAERISRHHPPLQLADVYAVLTYYLRHQAEVETYIQRRREKTRPSAPIVPHIPQPPAGLTRPEPEEAPFFPGGVTSTGGDVKDLADVRAELLARKHSGEKLSCEEEEHLKILTARLKEVLPPISPHELTVLLEMTNEVALIRERARERRWKLGLGSTTSDE